MLPANRRLTSKDINYMVKRHRPVHTATFSWYVIPQYPNRQYHQYSMHISAKLHKSAVIRRRFKRPILQYLAQSQRVDQSSQSGFYKIFGMINKRSLPRIVERLQRDGADMTVAWFVKQRHREWGEMQKGRKVQRVQKYQKFQKKQRLQRKER